MQVAYYRQMLGAFFLALSATDALGSIRVHFSQLPVPLAGTYLPTVTAVLIIERKICGDGYLHWTPVGTVRAACAANRNSVANDFSTLAEHIVFGF